MSQTVKDFIQKVIAFISWLTVVLSHHTIVVSKFDLQSASWMPFVQKKISYTYNGVGDIDLKSREEARKILLGEHSDKLRDTFWIGTIAELTANKGLEYGVAGVANLAKGSPSQDSPLQDIVYVIVGEGEKRAELETLIKKHNLTDKVFLVGFKENASALLAAFDVFLLPSLKEGLPYVLLEAGSAGIPVVASDVGGIPEIIESEVTGILTRSGKSEDISNSLSLIFQNKNKADEMKRFMRKKIDEKFSLSDMVSSTTKIY